MLKHLKRVFIQFGPGDPKSVSARELLMRVNGSRAKRSNPNCTVDFKIDEEADHGKAFVELHFADEEKRKVYLADRRTEEITRMMEEKGLELETKSVLKEVKYDPWKQENRIQEGTKFVKPKHLLPGL